MTVCLLVFFASVYATACTGPSVAQGTPCVCVNTGIEVNPTCGSPFTGTVGPGGVCVTVFGLCPAGFSCCQSCGNGTPEPGSVPQFNEQCDPGSTVGDCCAATCRFEPDTTPCPDATVCNGDETCGGGTCNPGTPLTCTDGNPCTDNGCDPVTGCTVTNNAASCNDGDICTTSDTCSSGSCSPGGPSSAPPCTCTTPLLIGGCPLLSLIIQRSPTSGMCVQLDHDLTGLGSVTLTGPWIFHGSQTFTPGVEYTGTFDVFALHRNAHDVIYALDLECFSGPCSGHSISLMYNGGCSFNAVFDDGSRKRAAGSVVGVTTVVSLAGTGNADPHFSGPNGEKFEFNGQPNGIYNLISSRQLVVNARMMAKGPKDHYMTQMMVVFGNVTLFFDTHARPTNYIEQFNNLLAPLGATASGNRHYTRLTLCDGQVVEIKQLHANPFFFLDIHFKVAGCHDDFGGILGQMYKCKYATGKELFAWDESAEESYRMPSMQATLAPFDVKAECYSAHEYGTPFKAAV